MMSKISLLTAIVFAVCLLSVPFMVAAAPANIDFVRSVYKDSQDIGLKHPESVACTDNYFVVADTGNDRLIKYTYQEDVIEPADFEMPVTAPIVVNVNSQGEIYALDGRDRRILILNADGTEKGYLSPRQAPVARKMMPKSFDIDQEDNIYLIDLSDQVVLILDSSGNYLRHIQFPEKYGFISDIAVDKQGDVFVVDSIDTAVYKAGPEDEQLMLLTKEFSEYVNFPAAIALDQSGTIYLVDKHGGSFILLNRDGTFQGHKFSYGWKEAQFYYPSQLCISPGGYYFVADRNNSRVQIFKAEE